MRYRLQHKQQYVMPNILGNHSFPVYSYRWVDIVCSNDLKAVKEYAGDLLNFPDWRIEDTRPFDE